MPLVAFLRCSSSMAAVPGVDMGPMSSDQPHLSANHRWLCSFICWPCGLTTDFVMRQDELDSFEVRCPDCPRNMELRSTEPFDDDSWSEEEFTDEDGDASDHDGDGGAPGNTERHRDSESSLCVRFGDDSVRKTTIC